VGVSDEREDSMKEVTTKQCAKLFNVSARAIQRWGDAGCPKIRRNCWDAEKVYAWREANKPERKEKRPLIDKTVQAKAKIIKTTAMALILNKSIDKAAMELGINYESLQKRIKQSRYLQSIIKEERILSRQETRRVVNKNIRIIRKNLKKINSEQEKITREKSRKIKASIRQQKHRDELSDVYVRKSLISYGLYAPDVTPEMIELKRAAIQLHRTLKEFKKWRKENEQSDCQNV